MPILEVVNDILRGCSLLARDGQNHEALKLLDGVIAEAEREGQRGVVQVLSQRAAEIAEPSGDLDLVARYCRKAVQCAPESAAAQFAAADILSRQGRRELAIEHAARCYLLLSASDSAQDRQLVRKIARRWPEAASQADLRVGMANVRPASSSILGPA